MPATTLTVSLEIQYRHEEEDKTREIVERVLDDGTFQDAINERASDNGIRLKVTGALVAPDGIHVTDPRCEPPRKDAPPARCVSNGDTPPCWALICPNPACGDVDTLIATYIDVRVTRSGPPVVEVYELRCTECGEKCKPPIKRER